MLHGKKGSFLHKLEDVDAIEPCTISHRVLSQVWGVRDTRPAPMSEIATIKVEGDVDFFGAPGLKQGSLLVSVRVVDVTSKSHVRRLC